MTKQNIGPARVISRVISITLIGILFVGLALVAALVALPGGATSAGPAPPKSGNLGNQANPNSMCWQEVPSPNPGGGGRLTGVAAVSAHDVWAVGVYFDGYRHRTLVEHWDGTAWSVVPSPNQGNSDNNLLGVAVVSVNDVWAVGDYNNGTDYQTLIEHWNGTAWSVVPSPNQGTGENHLTGVAAMSANDVWAVGFYTNNAGTLQTLTEHWNGTAWSIVSSPNPGSGGNTLYAVAAMSANDVWAVGDYYNSGSTTEKTLIEHWNGTVWSVVPSPNQDTGRNGLRGVAAMSADNVWAVGLYANNAGTLQTLTEHWNGSSWSVVPSPNQGTDENYLSGVAVVSANDVWAVGDYYNGTGYQTLIEHWNGTAWSVVPSPNPGTGEDHLTGVAAMSANDVWAVGKYVSGEKYHPLVERYMPCGGITPTPVPTPPTATPTPGPPTATPATPATPATRREPLPPPLALPGTESRTYPETGQRVSGVFLNYWDTHGGLAQQGYPISGVIGEVSELDGKPYTVQYFERAVFEYHPENQPPNDVLLSQLGTFRYQEKYPQGAPGQVPNTSEGSAVFPETGKRLGGKFLKYWQTHGGLAQQGYPISDEFTEKSEIDGKEYVVQYFERSVMELHPENSPPNEVLLSLLGVMQYTTKYDIKTGP